MSYERLKEIIKTINYFEERYGGSYEQIVLEKGEPNITGDWQWGREGGRVEESFNRNP